MIKKIVVVMMFLLLITSCKKQTSELYLISSPVSIVSFYKRQNNVIVTQFKPESLKLLTEKEGKTSDELLKSLYDVDKINIKIMDDSDFILFDRLFDSLTVIKKGENKYISYQRLLKGLRKTSFEARILELVNDEEGKNFLSLLSGNDNIFFISLDEFFSLSQSWEDKVEFFKIWIDEIGVYIK